MERKPVVIITGASGGIGEAAARLFGTRGWAVVLAARSTESLDRIAGEIQAQGRDGTRGPHRRDQARGPVPSGLDDV